MTTNQPPTLQIVKPPVINWFKAYCCVLCLMYLGVAAYSLVFFLVDPAELDMPRLAALIAGAALLLCGFTFLVLSLLPLFLRPRPWVWIYDLVIICVGMTSACFLPACIPLLIFWLKPETKAYFGRS
jgi:hypothetical protein